MISNKQVWRLGDYGRHFIKDHLSRLDQVEVFISGRRDKYGVPIQERPRQILLTDGAEFLDVAKHLRRPRVARLSSVTRRLSLNAVHHL